MKTGRIILGMAALLALGLTACTVTVDEGNPPPRPRPPRPDMCPHIYMPVCAERYGERQTFPNDCVAESRGFRVLYDGQCRMTPRPPRPPHPGPFPEHNPDGIACPMIQAPVCARQGRVFRTFSNSCIAEASGFDVMTSGDCQDIPNIAG